MRYKDNWSETKERFEAWWDRSCIGRPLMKVIARRPEPSGTLETEKPFADPESVYLDVDENVVRLRNFCKTHRYLAESYPCLDLNIGPGSLAVYIGSEPVFSWDTVWYQTSVQDWQTFSPLKFNPEAPWWKRHLAMIRQAAALAQGDFLVNIPDLIENADILSALRGAQAFCYDLVDRPEQMDEIFTQLDELYFRFYDPMYDTVKASDGSSSYTAFRIWGPGKTAKVQCDFSAMMSPSQFSRFIKPSLDKQCSQLDFSMYHLDGPDAVKHLDALMGIEKLDALQWTPGAAQPDGGHEKWYPIYDKVREAGKSLWIYLEDGSFEDWVRSADRLVRRYGPNGLYLLFPVMEEAEAAALLEKAREDWHS